jgi:hypothetical protein
LNIVRILLLLFFVGLLYSCDQKLSEKERKEIFALKEMSDLTTVEYTLSKVIKANDNKTWFKIGDRQILMSVQAYAKAGIDLSLLREEQLSLTKSNIKIILPRAKLISLSIPPEEIRQEMENVSLLRHQFSNEEKNNLLVQAEQNIRSSIDSLGILKKAEKNAVVFIENFIKKLGHKNVTVVIDSTNQY